MAAGRRSGAAPARLASAGESGRGHRAHGRRRRPRRVIAGSLAPDVGTPSVPAPVDFWVSRRPDGRFRARSDPARYDPARRDPGRARRRGASVAREERAAVRCRGRDRTVPPSDCARDLGAAGSSAGRGECDSQPDAWFPGRGWTLRRGEQHIAADPVDPDRGAAERHAESATGRACDPGGAQLGASRASRVEPGRGSARCRPAHRAAIDSHRDGSACADGGSGAADGYPSAPGDPRSAASTADGGHQADDARCPGADAGGRHEAVSPTDRDGEAADRAPARGQDGEGARPLGQVATTGRFTRAIAGAAAPADADPLRLTSSPAGSRPR